MKIKLAVGGKEYVADVLDMIENVTIGEIRTIKRETGMTPDTLKQELLDLSEVDTDDPAMQNWDLYTALVYLILSRASGGARWEDVERLPVIQLATGFSVIPDEDETPPTETVELPEPAAAGG